MTSDPKTPEDNTPDDKDVADDSGNKDEITATRTQDGAGRIPKDGDSTGSDLA